METAGANLEVGVPVTGGILCLGGDIEGEEAVLALADGLAVELPFRSIDLQGCRVAVRQGVSLVLDDSRHVQGITGPPDAPFSVHEGLETFLQDLSANVEAAQGALRAKLEISGAAASTAYDGKGPVGNLDLCQAVAAGLCRGYGLELVIVHFQ